MSSRHSGWQSITGISSANHRFLEKGDLCMHLMTRELHSDGERPVRYSEAHQKIANFKITKAELRANPLRGKYKEAAVRQFSDDLCGLFAQSESTFVLVPAVTSRVEGDSDFDDRIVRVCGNVAARLPQVRCERILSLTTPMPSASRSYGKRDPDIIRSHIAVEPCRDLSCDFVLIVDDVISSGAHFKACQRAILETYGVRAGGAFWARAESPLEQPIR